MTTVDFYFNAADKLQVACRLAGKAMAQSKRLYIHAPDDELARRVDRMLWTWPATGFVPHCRAGDPLAAETPVLIGAEPGEANDGGSVACEVLLNLAEDCPRDFERYARLLEIVSIDDADRAAGRARFRFYRERGYAIESHDLGEGGASEGGAS